MDCPKAITFISLHLDGMLLSNEETELAEHVAGCKKCALELALQKRLSHALRDMVRQETPAPPELCGQVMNSLRVERRTVLQWLPAAWRKAVAAAAALLIIAGGSAGVTTGLKLAGNDKMIGYETPLSEVNKDMGGGISTPNNQSGDSISTQSDPAQFPGALTAPENSRGENNPENIQDNDTSVISTFGNSTVDVLPKVDFGAKSTTTVATLSPNEMRTLLSTEVKSTEVKITSTLLKLAVSDLTEARIKAVSLAAGAGSATQVFPEQNGDKKIVVLRLTVTSDRATDLIAGLAKLGTLVDRQDESRDITSLYNETLVQHRNLQSRISQVQGTVEQQQLEAQVASYKQQLDTWKAEAGKRVIMLWLEG